tara:strand:+ start:258 stop:407 length:150 start_codon:yes stop_codon:yes gene_type:complete
MLLYTEKQLEDCYKQYCVFQGKHDMGFVSLEDFRILFENLLITTYEDIE